MATIPPGSRVAIQAKDADRLISPPPQTAGLWVVVHPHALRAGSRNRLTMVIGLDGAEQIVWVGALDEQMLGALPERKPGLRRQLRERLLVGERQWSLIFVRSLVTGEP